MQAAAIKLGPGDKPFTTSNAILAFCLYIAGIPFSDPKWPCKNEYTADKLREYGFKGRVDLIEAVKEAIATGKRGNVQYVFAKHSRLSQLLAAFKDQEAMITAEGSVIDLSAFQLDLMNRVAQHTMPPDEAALRSTCVTLKLRVLFTNMWRELPGILIVDNAGQATERETVKGRVVSYPGWTIVSTNAKPETLQRLGLV